MNKLQWASIILSLAGLFIFYAFGVGRPLLYWVNILVYIIAAVVIVMFFYMAFKRRYCAKCGAKLPIMRKPANANQALFGGCTCPNCKAELDSSGKLVKRKK